MAYGFNDNSYECLKALQTWDVFNSVREYHAKGVCIGSSLVNSIILDVDDRDDVGDVEGQEYIDKMVELGYVKVVV